MKSLTNRALSVIVSLLLIVSCISPCIVMNTDATEFTPFSAEIDFSRYTIQPAADASSAGNCRNVNNGSYIGNWEILEDETAKGGKILHRYNKGQQTTPMLYIIQLNPTGNAYDAIALAAETAYRVKIRHKLDVTKTGKALNLYLTHNTYSTKINSVVAANVMRLGSFAAGEGTANEDWVEETYYITVPSYQKSEYSSLTLGLAPLKDNNTPQNDYNAEWDWYVDYIAIDAVSKVDIHHIDAEGSDTLKSVYGMPGEKVELDSTFEYYTAYDSVTKTFSGKISGEKKFSTQKSEELYCFDDSFEPEAYEIDFSRYTLQPTADANSAGNCRNINIGSYIGNWEITEDETAKGGKILHRYSKGQQTSPMLYIIQLNPTGNAKDTIALSTDITYRVKIRHKLDITKTGKPLHLYITHNNSNTKLNSTNAANVIRLDSFEAGSGTENEDWTEATYYITVPAYKKSDTSSLTLGLAPLKDNNTPQNDYKAEWDWYVDYVTIDRVSAVEVYSDGSKIDTVYGAPDEILDVNEVEAPRRTGYSFVGWFEDEECSIYASTVTFKNLNVTKKLYAGWKELVSSALINDETYPDSIRSDTQKYNGWSSSTQYKNGISSFKSDKAGAVMQLVSAGGAIQLQNDGVYQMSFWYKATTATEVRFVTADENSFENSIAQGSISLGASNEWKRAFVTFTADAKLKDKLYLTVSKAGLYLDDIKLATVSEIVLDTNGGDALSSLNGEPGAVANLPTPVWAGHSFSGWYLDAECNRKISTVKYPVDSNCITIYAGWDIKEPWVTVDFENEEFKPATITSSNSFNKKKMSVIEDEKSSFAGSKYLKYTHEKGSGAYNAASSSFALYSNKNEFVTLENETTYSLSFWYKADSLSDDVRITAMTNMEYNYWLTSGQVNYSGNGYTIKASENGTDWKRGTIYFTTDLKNYEKEGSAYNGKLCDMLFFRINVNSDSNTVIYFDNITLDKLSDDTAIITKVLTGSDNEFVLSENGNKLDLGVPTVEGYRFLGWYEDSEYTKPIQNGIHTVNKHANVYAKWTLSYAKGSFEDYPDGWTSPNANGAGNNFRFPATSGMSLSENEAYSGNVSARYLSDSSYANPYSYMQLYNVNDIVVAGDTPLIVEEGQAYKFTIKYKLAKSQSDVKLTLWVGHRNNCWGNKENVGEYTVSYEEAGNGWKTATIFFTAKMKTAINDALYLQITGDGKTTDIYLDDFKVESMSGKSYIEFKPNNGENSTYVTGSVGEKIGKLPTPERKGYTFLGWYTDIDLKERFTGTVFGASSLQLYAKWTLTDEAIISFEDYYYRSSIAKLESDCAEVSADIASVGKYSMKIDKSDITNRTNAGLILVFDDLPFTVEDNTTYQITYDYYIKQNTTTTNASYTPYPNVRTGTNGNMWKDSFVPSETWRFSLAEETNIWKTASFMFTTELKSGKSNVLYFTVNATERFIGYFDNIRIKKVDRSEGEYAVSLNPTGATNVGDANLVFVGMPGDRVSLPDDIKRAGYTFTGWYTNKKCTDRVEENIFSFGGFDQTLYAGWASLGFTQDFENFPAEPKGRYYYMDFDYEIYNAAKEGNTKENVHSGNYSLHRKGEDFHKVAAQVITKELNVTLSPGQVYKLSMWVKLDKASHTKGAISIACSSLMTYAWAVDGEWKNISAISDLADNEWHEITYTFYATSNYLSILTPGNLSLFIDDISIELLENATAQDCDTPVICEEYIPVRAQGDQKPTVTERDLDLALIKSVDTEAISSGILDKLGIGGIVGISIGTVVLIAAMTVATIFLVKRRKKRGE